MLTASQRKAVAEARLRANIAADGQRRTTPGGCERNPQAFREWKEWGHKQLDEIARIHDGERSG